MDIEETEEELAIKRQIELLEDKLKAEKFKKEAKNNPFLKEHGIITINKGNLLFWRVFGVLCLILLVSSIVLTIYLVFYTDRLDGIVSSDFYQNTDNDYNITIPTENINNNDVNNNFTIVNQIYCNQTS